MASLGPSQVRDRRAADRRSIAARDGPDDRGGLAVPDGVGVAALSQALVIIEGPGLAAAP